MKTRKETMQDIHIELMQVHAEYKELFDKVIKLGKRIRENILLTDDVLDKEIKK
jgi:hypothetical protein